MTPRRRYDLAPLAALMGMSEHAACVQLGLSGSTQQDYRAHGVTLEVAERLAFKAGVHPFEVWSSMPEDGRRDRQARYARERWANDPDHRAARADYMRRYRADAAKALAAQKRRWAAENRPLVRERNREATRRWRERKAQERAA